MFGNRRSPSSSSSFSSSSSLQLLMLLLDTITHRQRWKQVQLHNGISHDNWIKSKQEGDISLYLTSSKLVWADTNIACCCHSTPDRWMDTEGKFGSVSRSSLSASYNRKQIPCTWEGKIRHATIASTNSAVKQRHLCRMLKALRAEASVTSIASGCQRWLKSWEQASVLKILCVGVWVRTSQSSKSDIWGALYRSQRLLGIFCIT